MIRDSQLAILFATLPAPDADGASGPVYSGITIPFAEPHRIAKDLLGDPSILIESHDPSYSHSPPVVLENLAVLHKVMCRITKASEHTEEGPFTVVTCRSRDTDTRSYFFWIAEHLIRTVGGRPSAATVTDAVEHLVELFNSLSRPAERSVQGLWAELLVIAIAPSPAEVIKYWRAQPDERFDFLSETQRVEVKSTLSSVRAHHFSYEQLNPPAGTFAIVVSVLLSRASGGLNVFDLTEQIQQGVARDATAAYRLQYIVGMTLGRDRSHAAEYRFDKDVAVQSLRFVEVCNIPSLVSPIPPEITEVSFKADLTQVPTADLRKNVSRGGLFRAMIPVR